MKVNELSDYIKKLRNIISEKVPKDELDDVMTDVSNYILSRWVYSYPHVLSNKEIIDLIKIGKKKNISLNRDELKSLIEKYKKSN